MMRWVEQILWIGIFLCTTGIVAGEPTTLVFPFERTDSGTDHAWVGYAFELILEESWPAVPIQDRLVAVDEMDLPEGTPLTYATRIRLAEGLGADRMVTGSYVVSDGRIHVDMVIFNLKDRSRAVKTFDAVLEDMPDSLRDPIEALPGGTFPYEGGLTSAAFEQYVRGVLQAVIRGRFDDLLALEQDGNLGKRVGVRLADLYFHSEDFEAALPRLMVLAASDPAYFLKAGWAAVQTGSYQQGASCYLRGLQHSQNATTLMNAAGCLARSGAIADASVVLSAISAEEAGADIRFNRCVLEAASGRYLAAMDMLKRAVEEHRITDDGEELAAYICGKLAGTGVHDLCAVVDVPETGEPEFDVTALFRFEQNAPEKGARVDLTDVKALYLRLARERLADGDSGAAREGLIRVLEMDPVHREALTLMCEQCGDEPSCRLLERLNRLAAEVAAFPAE